MDKRKYEYVVSAVKRISKEWSASTSSTIDFGSCELAWKVLTLFPLLIEENSKLRSIVNNCDADISNLQLKISKAVREID